MIPYEGQQRKDFRMLCKGRVSLSLKGDKRIDKITDVTLALALLQETTCYSWLETESGEVIPKHGSLKVKDTSVMLTVVKERDYGTSTLYMLESTGRTNAVTLLREQLPFHMRKLSQGSVIRADVKFLKDLGHVAVVRFNGMITY